MNVQFEVQLPSFAIVTDMEISENHIFLLTNKHEVLAYDQKGEFVFDTLFATPRLYPNGSVEVYLENTFQSLFYFENALFFLGTNPPDMYRLDLTQKEFSKKRLTMSERGLHQVMNSNVDELLVSFNNPQKGIFEFFKIDFPGITPILLGEISNSKSPFTSYFVQDKLYLINAIEKGIYVFENNQFIKNHDEFFLDSILFKGELKGVTDLGHYASLEPWERNQYRSDKILSVLQTSKTEIFFLLKLLNRTNPKNPEFQIVLIKQTGDKLQRKILENYQFAKLDKETQSFLGYTFENEAVVIGHLDSLVTGD